MSDASENLDFWGRQLLKKSQTNPLREKMRAFVSEHPPRDLEDTRSEASDGTNLSTLVDEGREERF